MFGYFKINPFTTRRLPFKELNYLELAKVRKLSVSLSKVGCRPYTRYNSKVRP